MTGSIAPPGTAEFECWCGSAELEFVAGRYCAGEALRRLGVRDHESIGRGADGAPQWPSGVVGSISHTRGVAWSAVGWRSGFRGLGVDAEPLMGARRARIIASRIGTRDELAAIMSEGSFDHRTAMTVAFCLKEALFKCLYPEVGRVFDFRDVRLEAPDVPAGRVVARLTSRLSPDLPRGTRLEARYRMDGGYAFASASLST